MKLIGTALILFAVAILGPGEAVAQKLFSPVKRYVGTVTDDGTTAAGEGYVVVFEDPYPEPVTSSKINPENGQYSVVLDQAKLYRFRVEALGHYGTEFYISTPPGGEYQEIREDFLVREVPIDSVLWERTPFAEGITLSDTTGLSLAVAFLHREPMVTTEMKVGAASDEVTQEIKDRVAEMKRIIRADGISLSRVTFKLAPELEAGRYQMRIVGFDLEEARE